MRKADATMQWYDWMALFLTIFYVVYVVLCSDLAWKATRPWRAAESMPPPQPMTIAQAIRYGEMLLNAVDEETDQQRYFEDL